MPADKNLTETLKTAIAETSDTAKTVQKETQADMSKGTEGAKAKSEPVYVAGVDVSDVPDNVREALKAKLEEKAGLLEKGYNKKFQDVAALKKLKDEISNMGLTEDEVRTAVIEKLQAKTKSSESTASEKKEAKKLLDKFAEMNPDEAERLKNLREVILEEAGYKEIREELENLKKEMRSTKEITTMTVREKKEAEIESLKSVYGADLVDEYHDVLLNEGLRQPRMSVRSLLFAIAPDKVEEVISKKAEKKKTIPDEKREAISSPSKGLSSSTEAVNTKQPWKGFFRELTKK